MTGDLYGEVRASPVLRSARENVRPFGSFQLNLLYSRLDWPSVDAKRGAERRLSRVKGIRTRYAHDTRV